jgi:O-succinylbenzoic acid--CoA ligase
MDVRTPAGWLEHHAEATPDAVALVFADGTVTFGQLMDQVHRRAPGLRSIVAIADVVPVPVRLDLASIVEILAHHEVGAVPLPYVGEVPRPAVAKAPGAALCIQTSGSSGRRRLVPLTMANLSASVGASRTRLGTTSVDTWLLSLPLDHVGGLSVLYRMLEAGGSVVVEPFGGGIGAMIDRTRPTIASFVPTMVHRLMRTDRDRLASIGTLLVGGGPVAAGLTAETLRAGIHMTISYGMTETASQVATMAPGTTQPRHGWVGQPLPGFDVAIAPLPGSLHGEGRIVVDGPAVFHGYLGDDVRSDPFVTSDIGVKDQDGALIVIGRADQVVVTGGENVALPYVEETIAELPEVDEVAVVAVDDPEWGASICALIVSDRSVDAIREDAVRMLARHEVPRHWESTDALPLLPNGKRDLSAIKDGFARRGHSAR